MRCICGKNKRGLDQEFHVWNLRLLKNWQKKEQDGINCASNSSLIEVDGYEKSTFRQKMLANRQNIQLTVPNLQIWHYSLLGVA